MSKREAEKMLTTGQMLKKMMVITVLVVIGAAVFIWLMPKGYNDDLTLVGKGKNTVVLGYDDEVVQSSELMHALDQIRDRYRGRAEFLVADVTTGPGQQFQRLHGIHTNTVMCFSPDGRLLATIVHPQTPESLEQAINQAFHFQ